VHAYVLMTNHVHVLMTPYQPNSLAKVLQALGRRYVPYINATYQRTGTLWEGRYRASLVDADQYLFACYRYIELNPVRAGMVQDPAEYPWSSYQWHAYGQPDPVITDHALYLALGTTMQERQTAYRALFQHHIDENLLQRDPRHPPPGRLGHGALQGCHGSRLSATRAAREARAAEETVPGTDGTHQY
jgi:putative transposase